MRHASSPNDSGRNQIPYSLVDTNASRESIYGKALLGLLQLAGSRFTRKEVFGVLYNPCVQAGIGASRNDIDTWLNWARKLGIEPEVVSTSPIKIACHIAVADVERAVKALHSAFELDTEVAERIHG